MERIYNNNRNGILKPNLKNIDIMKWLDAIIEVLRKAEEPMHYGDIAVEIVETKKR